MIKLLLADTYRKMFFIGQNLKHVHITFSFLEFLFFFLSLVVDICFEFIFNYIRKILHANTNSKGNQSWNNNIELYIFTVSDIDIEKLFFFMYI